MPITPLYATADGGVIVTSSWNGTLGTLYQLDQNGNTTSQMPDLGAVLSWTNQWYAGVGGYSVSALALPVPKLAESYWPIVGANNSNTGTAIPPGEVTVFWLEGLGINAFGHIALNVNDDPSE